MQRAVNIGQINRFMFEMKIGDVLLCPYDNDILLIGEVLSDIYYDSSNSLPWSYCRKVNWLIEISRSIYSVPLQNTLRSMQTAFKIKQESEVLKSMGRTVDDTPIVSSAFEVEKLIEKIKERLLELDAYEFELLVSYVLQSLGFEAKQRQGGTGDGGVDFEGVLYVMVLQKLNYRFR